MELIDRRINIYYNLANTRIMLMVSNGVRLEVMLNRFLTHLGQLPQEQRQEILRKTADCVQISSQRYIGTRSFEKIIRARNEGHSIALPKARLSEEDKTVRTEPLFSSVQDQYAMDRVEQYLNTVMGKRDSTSIKELAPGQRNELLSLAAAIMYGKNEEFPFDVSIRKEMVSSDCGSINDAVIRRLGKES